MSNPFADDHVAIAKSKIQAPISTGFTSTTTAQVTIGTLVAVSADRLEGIDKPLLSALYALWLWTGIMMISMSRLDHLNNLQYRAIAAVYFSMLPLLIIGYIGLPWVTLCASVLGAVFGGMVVGSPQSSDKLKEATALCLSAACISGWIENICHGMFVKIVSYGSFLATVVHPTSAFVYSLCRAPVALSTVGAIYYALRVLTVRTAKPSVFGMGLISFTSVSVSLHGAASLLYLFTGTAGAAHPLPFFGSPPKLVLHTGEWGVLASILIIGTAATYVWKDVHTRRHLNTLLPTNVASSEETDPLQPLAHPEGERWQRSFSDLREKAGAQGDDRSDSEV